MIHNLGKTPGTIIKFEWGRCPKTDFSEETPVSKIIDRGLLPLAEIITSHKVMYLPGDADPYRPVELPERNVGEVLFGRITYKDIFRKKRYSTFALSNLAEHTDSIGMSFADDWC